MIRSIFSFRSLAYCSYALLLTAVLLYVRFPAEKFKKYCEKRVELVLPGSTCAIDSIAHHFPLSVDFENIKISKALDGQESEMVVDRLLISPVPLQFWRSFTVHGEIYSGLFDAALEIDRKTNSFQLDTLYAEGLDAGKIAAGIGVTEREVSGVVNFSGRYQGQSSNIGDGSGNGDVQIVSGSMSLMQPILALTTLEFEKLAVSVTYEKGSFGFLDGELLGKEMDVDFTGEMRMASPVVNSNIILSGHLQPDEDFLRNNPQEQQLVQRLLQRYKMTVLPFKVGGTVKRPLFRFST